MIFYRQPKSVTIYERLAYVRGGLLQEDESDLLQENSYRLLLEQAMPDLAITQTTLATSLDIRLDMVPVVDVSDTTNSPNGRTKHISVGNLAEAIGIVNVKNYGAVGDGVTDDTAAITAADTAACSGVLGLDGVTRLAQAAVYLPAGTYKHTGLTYRGAPWVGDGMNATILDYYGSGASVDAVGTSSAVRMLNISGMTLSGANASAGAYGLRMGYNQRSLGALRRVRIDTFPTRGIYFDDENWILSFEDVYISFCGTTAGSGIEVDPTVVTLASFDWHNLTIEQCGENGNAKGGGMNIDSASAINKWAFYGGTWEGNHGSAEARFVSASAGISAVTLVGVYTESGLAADGVVDGLIFGGDIHATLIGCHHQAVNSHAGVAIKAQNTARILIENPYINANWPTLIEAQNTANITIGSRGNIGAGTVTLASGATLYEDHGRTYDPTLNNITNLDGSTAYTCMYRRVGGNQVTVSGKFDADPTAAAITQLDISLPIASNLAAQEDLGGIASNGTGEVARIYAETTNNRAVVLWTATTTVNAGWSFEFTYRII